MPSDMFRPNYHFFNNELSENFCLRVEKYIKNLNLDDATVFDDFKERKLKTDVRRAKVHLYEFKDAKDGIEREIGLEFFRICSIVNRDYQFTLNDDNFIIQLTYYKEDDKGTYDWHCDDNFLARGFYRKLSMAAIIKKSDEGGEFDLSGGCPDFNQEVGSVIAFPSFVEHKVHPVTKGERISIVIWFCGPQWN